MLPATGTLLVLIIVARLPMPDAMLLAIAREARERAEEVLTRAETFTEPEARRMMRQTAEMYGKLAEELEEVARSTAADE